jgi:cytochrome c-type biogenesis protein
MLDIVLALAAGVLTVAAPCVLPMLPIILGVSVGQRDPARPLLITLGFAATFALMAFLFGLFPTVLGLSHDALRDAASIMLIMFGLLMIWPHPLELVTARFGNVFASAGASGTGRSERWAALLLGASLGAVWAPCAGPMLGSILTLIASAQRLDHAATLLACYSLGAAVPMLLIAYGGQVASTRARHLVHYTRSLQRGFGVVIVLVAIAMFYQYDAVIAVWLSHYYPDLTVWL